MRWIHYYILYAYSKLHSQPPSAPWSLFKAAPRECIICEQLLHHIVSERVRVKGKKRYATKGHNEIYCHVCCMLLGKLEGTHTIALIYFTLKTQRWSSLYPVKTAEEIPYLLDT